MDEVDLTQALEIYVETNPVAHGRWHLMPDDRIIFVPDDGQTRESILPVSTLMAKLDRGELRTVRPPLRSRVEDVTSDPGEDAAWLHEGRFGLAEGSGRSTAGLVGSGCAGRGRGVEAPARAPGEQCRGGWARARAGGSGAGVYRGRRAGRGAAARGREVETAVDGDDVGPGQDLVGQGPQLSAAAGAGVELGPER